MLRIHIARRHLAAYLEVMLALACCTLDLTLLAVPLVGLMFLPSLFGAVCWASAALKNAELID
ncbi:MAG TPA: hypothetical protein VMG12_13845 [Polyangiaceae bacterium]|nr:hypothetical protein [Polyangiaceae bacterium]